MNFTDRETPFTRIVEHKFFEMMGDEVQQLPKTIITKEYPAEYSKSAEAYYPINNEENNKRYLLYKILANQEKNVIFGGRLAEYKYYDMDDTIKRAIDECCIRINSEKF